MENQFETLNMIKPEKQDEQTHVQQEEPKKTLGEPPGKLLSILKGINLPKGEAEAEHVLVEELSKRRILIEPISGKRGFKIYLVEVDDKRFAVWLREKPVSRKALELAERILKNYEIDGKILVKLVRKADYTKILSWIKACGR